MSSIISQTNLEKIVNLRKYVLKFAIWILVGAVIVGAFTILFGGSDSYVIMLKFMGTLFIVALMLMISVNNFRMVATEIPTAQIFALMGLCSNLIWGVLWILLCWNPEWGSTCSSYPKSICEESMLIKFAIIFSYLSFLGFVGSNVMNIYEGDKKNLIRPLKITAVVCATYEMLYAAIVVFFDIDISKSEILQRLSMLALFVGFAWFFIVIAALVISKREKNKEAVAIQNAKNEKAKKFDEQNSAVKSDADLRAEIEEKVRREMIEKEVRDKIEKEMQGQSQADSK